jgi:hypothetical protein
MKAFIGAVAIAAVFSSGQALAADTYAAIAFSQVNGASGSWHRAGTRAQAEEGALQQCGESCRVIVWVRNQCAVLAVGDGYGYGFSYSTDGDQAVRTALEKCDQETSSCELNVMICSAD